MKRLDRRRFLARSAGALAALALAVGGDAVLGYNLQDHFDGQLAAGRTRDGALRRMAEMSRELPATLPQLAAYLGDQQPAARE